MEIGQKVSFTLTGEIVGFDYGELTLVKIKDGRFLFVPLNILKAVEPEIEETEIKVVVEDIYSLKITNK